MAALPPARQAQLVREEIDAARVNWAHIGIARLERGGIIDAILTPNFDPLASRACALFNRFPAVYDLAGLRDAGNNRIDFDKSYVKGSAPFNHGLFWITRDDKEPPRNVCDTLLSLEDCHIVRNAPSDLFFTKLANALSVRSPGFLVNPFEHMLGTLETLRPFSDVTPDNANDLLFKGKGTGPDLLASAKNILAAASLQAAEQRPDQARLAELIATGKDSEKCGNASDRLPTGFPTRTAAK